MIFGLGLAVVLAFATLSVGPAEAEAGQSDAWPPAPIRASAKACAGPMTGSNRTINVGPGHEHSELTSVPWLSLTAGDVVNIHYRTEPYRTKLGLRAQGTESQPVVINGVTDRQCRRPTITGADAETPDDAVATQFFNTEWTEFLGTIFIYRGPDDPFGYIPSNITIQNLKITGASTEDSYTGQNGARRNYGKGAAGVYSVVVENLTLNNNEITGNGNGVFVNSKSEEETSRNIIIRHNRIYDNGTPGSYLEHNLYIQARRALYEGNYLGQLVVGAEGSSLKDRSSGTVVRFNHIDAAARAIDLVEIEGGVGPVFNDPLYSTAWVYGNTIVTDHSTEALSSSLLIHWGGDNDPRYFRNGTLHAYHNTIVIDATRAQYYWFAIFDQADERQKVEAHSNTIVNRHDALMYLGRDHGTIELTGTNWITSGWLDGKSEAVTVIESGTIVAGTDPDLSPDLVPNAGSPLIDRTATVPIAAPAPAVADHLRADSSFVDPSGLAARPRNGSALDLGAKEAGGAPPSEPGPTPSEPAKPTPTTPTTPQPTKPAKPAPTATQPTKPAPTTPTTPTEAPKVDLEPSVIAGGITHKRGGAAANVTINLYLAEHDGSRGDWLDSQRTGADGRFRFEPTPGCYVIGVKAPRGHRFQSSHRWHEVTMCREAGQINPEAEMVLVPNRRRCGRWSRFGSADRSMVRAEWNTTCWLWRYRWRGSR